MGVAYQWFKATLPACGPFVERCLPGAGRPGFPAVAFDVSWLCYTCRRSTVADTIEHVMAMMLKFLDESFIFYPVFDPEGRRFIAKA